MNWHSRNSGNGQALVIEEETGKNIAVAYDEENGDILASAPLAISLLKETLETLESMTTEQFSRGKDKNLRLKIIEFLSSIE